MIYLYAYLLVCGIFAVIYAFGRTFVYLTSDKMKMLISQDDNVNNYIKVGFGVLAVLIVLVVFTTVLAPLVIIEPLIKKKNKAVPK